MNNRFESERRSGSHMMTQFTKETLEQRLLDLQQELKRHQQEMGGAVDKGDEYHDNFAFEEASRQVDITSSMISEVRGKLADVEIIKPCEHIDKVAIGNSVVLRFAGESEDEIFTLLGPDDAGLKPGWVSYESPIGLRLLGKKVGNKIEYQIQGQPSQNIIIKAILPGSF